MRNRKFLRKFMPLHEDPSDRLKQPPTSVPDITPVSQQPSPTYPAVPCVPPTEQRPHLPMPQEQPDSSVHTRFADGSPPGPARPASAWAPPSASPAYQPVMPASPASHQLPATQPEFAPLQALMHPQSSPVRRSSRSNKGVTSKFDDYMTGDELDISNLSTPCSLCHAPVRTQQPAPFYVQSMACSSQLPTPQPGPARARSSPINTNPTSPINTNPTSPINTNPTNLATPPVISTPSSATLSPWDQ